jgi:Holliday junction resolvase RusA-like endonuclease
MKTRVTLSMLPPSVNHAFIRRQTGQVIRTDAYRTWCNGEGYQLNRQLAEQHRFDGPVFITMAMRRPRSNADLDNRLKPIGDLLQKSGAISNDKLIMGWNVYWSNTLPDGVAAEISIVAADDVGEAA